MNKKKKGVFITERDMRFFRYLHSVKVVTYKQAFRDMYSDYSYKGAENRIRKLEDNRFIRGCRFRTLLNGKRVISLSNKAFNLFVKNGLEQRVELESDSVLHDLDLGDIRSSFLKLNRVQMYLTENELQTWGHSINDSAYSTFVSLNSDAVVDFKFLKCNLKIPLEYDKTHKASYRYEKILHKYYTRDDIHIVLYVCKNKKMMNQLMEAEKKIFKQEMPKFFYILKSNILKNNSFLFLNCMQEELNLESSLK